MRMRSHHQEGFSIVEVVIVVVVIAAMGLVGYAVKTRISGATVGSSIPRSAETLTVQSAKASDVLPVPTVSSSNDLDKALATVDQTDPSGSNNTDAAELDSQISQF